MRSSRSAERVGGCKIWSGAAGTVPVNPETVVEFDCKTVPSLLEDDPRFDGEVFENLGE